MTSSLVSVAVPLSAVWLIATGFPAPAWAQPAVSAERPEAAAPASVEEPAQPTATRPADLAPRVIVIAPSASPPPASQSAEPSSDEPDDRPKRRSSRYPHRVGLFISPASVIFGTLPIELDVRVVGPVTLNAQFVALTESGVSGFAVAGGPQVFFSGRAFDGGYILPMVVYASASRGGASATAFGGGATLGYQWLIGYFGLRLGGGLVYYSGSGQSSTAEATFDGVSPVVDAAIGLSF